jgi:hypothetical protein
MRRASLFIVIATVVAGCSVLRGSSGPTPESELQRGLAALRSQDYGAARAILEPLYRAHWMDETGQRALLVLAAAELDPRNADRRLPAATELAGTLLNVKDVPAWEIPVTESLYLLSLEIGSQEAAIARAENAEREALNAAQVAKQTSAAGSVTLPRLTRESWPSQLRKVREDRDALAKKVDQLQSAVKARDKDLAEAKQELERIKKTLKIK